VGRGLTFTGVKLSGTQPITDSYLYAITCIIPSLGAFSTIDEDIIVLSRRANKGRTFG